MNILDYELTRTVCQFLDCHLTFPLLEFLFTKEMYEETELLEFILETVNKTNMIDYIMDIRGRLQLGSEIPKELAKRKTDVLAKLKQLKTEVAPIMKATEILKCDETIKDSKTFVNVLQKDYNFQINHLDSAYKLAKYLYECGNYQESTSYLYFCLIVMMPSDKNYANVLWGKLAAEILTLNWTSALEDLNRLRDFIDSTACTAIQALQQRTWLIHWSLFVFFNHPKGRDHIIDLFFYRPFYLNAIETVCPHVMRYASAAIIMNRSRRNALKDLVKVIQQESYSYRDPITEFIESLFVDFDFDKAKIKMHECQTIIINDFFLVSFLHEFIESARLMILETFCQIHHCATIKMLAEILNMPPAEAEEWIINLIRNERLNAQFDSKLGHVVMKSKATPAHQQLVEKIDALVNRSDQLVAIVDRLAKQKNPEPIDAWKYYKN